MNQDSFQSVFREHMLTHLLLGELLKINWKQGKANLEISFPAIDRAGHDVLLEANGCTRHVQFKSSALDGKTAYSKVHVDLCKKPSGCVVWIQFDPKTLELGPFLFFGGSPGSPLPPLEDFKVARHTKGNKDGVKAERPNHREIPKSRFSKLATVDELYLALFG